MRQTMITTAVAVAATASTVTGVRQCAYELSGYFFLHGEKMSYEEAASECVRRGAVLAPGEGAIAQGLEQIMAVCSEWDMDVPEGAWVARRVGDTSCRYLGNPVFSSGRDDTEVEAEAEAASGARVIGCGEWVKQEAALCWRYPVKTRTVTEHEYQTLVETGYAPRVVATRFEIDPLLGPTPEKTAMVRETRTVTKERRVPKYIPEWVDRGPNLTLTETVYTTVSIVKEEPERTVTEREQVVAVVHLTEWQMRTVGTDYVTVSVGC